jgi:hypothetical protein
MHRISKWSGHLSVLAALSHIFCCGLPLVASIVSLGASAGGTIGVSALHDALHVWELEIIIFSGAMLALSAVSIYIARQIDCHTEGHCHHEPCKPKKNLSLNLFLLATVIFAINVSVYVLHEEPASAVQHETHHGHSH